MIMQIAGRCVTVNDVMQINNVIGGVCYSFLVYSFNGLLKWFCRTLSKISVEFTVG